MKKQALESERPKSIIVGEAYRELKARVERYSRAGYPVMFVGERGSGKEVFAQHYMNTSPSKGEKMAINCAAVSDTLLPSEVFGHKKGAFTGAMDNRKGKLMACKDGILFLDEIGDASTQFQAAILRVVEHNGFSQVGADDEIKDVNVVIIAATNNPGALREDLKDRFNILYVPPLQREDIQVLTEHFLGKPLKLELMEELKKREYKGNIRELKRICERWKAERGNDIFTRNSKKNVMSAFQFDYDRYERELKAWNKFIMPALRDGGIDIGYRYVTKRVSSISELDIEERNMIEGEWDSCVENIDQFHMMLREHKYHGIANMIDWIGNNAFPIGDHQFKPLDNNNKTALLNKLRSNLGQIVEKELVPYLIDELEGKSQQGQYLNDFLDINTGSPAMVRSKAPVPDPSVLLRLPPQDAMTEFQRAYYKHHLHRNGGKRSETARDLDLNINTLKTTLRRLGLGSK
ncbi:MAG: sigma-54-dependent transcriptional regulator [Syntrophobacteraceae bacterium]